MMTTIPRGSNLGTCARPGYYVSGLAALYGKEGRDSQRDRPCCRGTIRITRSDDSGSGGEDLLRLAVEKTLRKRGFSVVEASDGSAALGLIRANKDSINVVLLDVTLPGMLSREVFEETQRIRPDLKVVLTSA